MVFPFTGSISVLNFFSAREGTKGDKSVQLLKQAENKALGNGG